ncbi:carboxylating nicotinate-nucleotide diphosphorylase [candidate division WOR-3 bacterium]|nr:carboxylating nicotinate-nucleotide diphosphorylase [candidate division WOR-3 bacterium]
MHDKAFKEEIAEVVRIVLSEDIGSGDATTLATIPEESCNKAVILCKQEGVFAGMPVVEEVFSQVEERIEVDFMVKDSDVISKGQEIARISGPARGILTAERTALNFLQRLSGIATLTSRFVERVQGTKAKILDTRKTTPGLRVLEKYAVRCGGGYNHRMGLYDMVMIKDNHIAAAGSITNAVKSVLDTHSDLKIEVECKSLDEVKEALSVGGLDRIMLDNMSLDTMKEAVSLVSGRVELEASGGVTLETVAGIAATGVDYISVGALTHSAKALDISLEIVT